MLTRRLFLASGTAITALVLGDLRGSRPTSAQGRSVNLYSSRHYDTDEALFAGFTRSSGMGTNLIEATANELIARIKSEGRNSPADLLITVDAGNLWMAEQEDLLVSVNSEILKSRIPEALRHPQGRWFGFSTRARVIFYNRDRVDPAQLSTYEDLATPKWRGKILMRSSSNIYNQSLVASLIAVHGTARTEEWLRGFVRNFARPPEGNDTAQIQDCAAGRGDITLANTYYYARLAKSENPADREVVAKVGIFFPNQDNRGTHVNISGAGVLRHAPNQPGAIAFLEHLTTPEAQGYFSSGNNEYPVVAGAPVDPVVAGLGDFKADLETGAVKYGQNQAEAIRLMDQVGWR